MHGVPRCGYESRWTVAAGHLRTRGRDRHETLDVSTLKPQITWGTTPAMTVDIDQPIVTTCYATSDPAVLSEAAEHGSAYIYLVAAYGRSGTVGPPDLGTLTPVLETLRAQTDAHAIDRDRANGVVSNMPEFQKAWGCKAGQPMVAENACHVW